MKGIRKIIEYQCPMCSDTVPLAEITATRTGWWKPNIEVTVEGDATDYVAHMWAHQQRRI
jgi:hypothetical protein